MSLRKSMSECIANPDGGTFGPNHDGYSETVSKFVADNKRTNEKHTTETG